MGSLSRSIRRKYEQRNRHRDMRELYAHVERLTDEAEERIKKENATARMDEDTHNMTMAMYYLFGITLHRMYGFGQSRVLKLYEAIDAEIGTWRAGEVTVEDLRQQLADAVGIDIKLK